jgi:hypothetical protein
MRSVAKSRKHHEIWEDQIGSEVVGTPLRTERVVPEIADVVLAAEEDLSAVVVPMPKFVSKGKAATLPHAEATACGKITVRVSACGRPKAPPST